MSQNFNWTKHKVAQILTSTVTVNCLMTSYLRHSDDAIKRFCVLRDFVSGYPRAKFGGNWTTNRTNIQGALCAPLPPAETIWYQNTPACIWLISTLKRHMMCMWNHVNISNYTWKGSVFRFYIGAIREVKSVMVTHTITDTEFENCNWPGGIRTHNLTRLLLCHERHTSLTYA